MTSDFDENGRSRSRFRMGRIGKRSGNISGATAIWFGAGCPSADCFGGVCGDFTKAGAGLCLSGIWGSGASGWTNTCAKGTFARGDAGRTGVEGMGATVRMPAARNGRVSLARRASDTEGLVAISSRTADTPGERAGATDASTPRDKLTATVCGVSSECVGIATRSTGAASRIGTTGGGVARCVRAVGAAPGCSSFAICSLTVTGGARLPALATVPTGRMPDARILCKNPLMRIPPFVRSRDRARSSEAADSVVAGSAS